MHPNHHHGAAASGLAAPELAHRVVVELAPLGAAGAAPAGLSQPPTSDNARWQAGEVERQETADNADCADAAAQRKRFNTLRARLALAGWVLTDTPDSPHGAFTVSRWAMARDLVDLAAVEAFSAQVGAPS